MIAPKWQFLATSKAKLNSLEYALWVCMLLEQNFITIYNQDENYETVKYAHGKRMKLNIF